LAAEIASRWALVLGASSGFGEACSIALAAGAIAAEHPLTALFIISGQEAWYAFQINETSDQTPWRPILWPFKAAVPLACLLLLIQGLSEFLKSFYMARTGVELEHKEKVEI